MISGIGNFPVGSVATPQRLAVPAPPPPVGGPVDAVDLGSSTSVAQTPESAKNWRALAWGGFGVEMIGGAMTLAGHPLGLPVFIVGTAAMVAGETMARKG